MAPKYRYTRNDRNAEDARREPPRICSVSGKRMYASEREAQDTARHRLSDERNAPAKLRTYRCLYCDSWHLTSKES